MRANFRRELLCYFRSNSSSRTRCVLQQGCSLEDALYDNLRAPLLFKLRWSPSLGTRTMNYSKQTMLRSLEHHLQLTSVLNHLQETATVERLLSNVVRLDEEEKART